MKNSIISMMLLNHILYFIRRKYKTCVFVMPKPYTNDILLELQYDGYVANIRISERAYDGSLMFEIVRSTGDFALIFKSNFENHFKDCEIRGKNQFKFWCKHEDLEASIMAKQLKNETQKATPPVGISSIE